MPDDADVEHGGGDEVRRMMTTMMRMVRPSYRQLDGMVEEGAYRVVGGDAGDGGVMLVVDEDGDGD